MFFKLAGFMRDLVIVMTLRHWAGEMNEWMNEWMNE